MRKWMREEPELVWLAAICLFIGLWFYALWQVDSEKIAACGDRGYHREITAVINGNSYSEIVCGKRGE
jgi:hypothetical protein